jgi:HAD superfamily hydrolase (TIGR01509 family)
MRAPGLVIFDCDGVLIDSEVVACRNEAACLAAIGIAITPEELVDRYAGMSVAAMFADIETRYRRRLPADFAQTLDRHAMAAFEAELTAMAGVEAVLASLACPACVASSSSPARLRGSLSLAGLLRYFDPHVFSAAQVPRGKPAPDLFLLAARSMDVAPEDCVVIEDSVAGVQAAVAGGMRVYGFVGGGHCRPGHADRLREAGAAATFGRMGELPAVLRAR